MSADKKASGGKKCNLPPKKTKKLGDIANPRDKNCEFGKRRRKPVRSCRDSPVICQLKQSREENIAQLRSTTIALMMMAPRELQSKQLRLETHRKKEDSLIDIYNI